MEKKSQDFSMEDIARLAQSPAARQLYDTLQSQDGDAVRRATDQAAAGDYAAAQRTLSALLSSPEIRALMRQLGG